MPKMVVNYTFQDIHSGDLYEAGTVQEFSDERVAEINKNLPGFISEIQGKPAADEQVEKPKRSRKKKEVTDELPAGETEV